MSTPFEVDVPAEKVLLRAFTDIESMTDNTMRGLYCWRAYGMVSAMMLTGVINIDIYSRANDWIEAREGNSWGQA